jgi:hypothetical protein
LRWQRRVCAAIDLIELFPKVATVLACRGFSDISMSRSRAPSSAHRSARVAPRGSHERQRRDRPRRSLPASLRLAAFVSSLRAPVPPSGAFLMAGARPLNYSAEARAQCRLADEYCAACPELVPGFVGRPFFIFNQPNQTSARLAELGSAAPRMPNILGKLEGVGSGHV